MADVIISNRLILSETQPIFVLVESLLAAGWTHVESSRGTGDTPSTSNRWTSLEGLGTNAWVVVSAPSGQQVIIRLGTTAGSGWIVWNPSGGYTTGSGTSTTPGALSASSHFIRGSGASPSTWTSQATLLGNIGATNLVLAVRDVTTSEDFWIVTQSADSTYSGASGRLFLAKVEHMPGTGQADPMPYAWHCPAVSTSSWGTSFTTGTTSATDSASTGTWRRVWNAGQAGEVVKRYGLSIIMPITNTTGANLPTSDRTANVAVHQTTPQRFAFRGRLTKAGEAGFHDPDGGAVQGIMIAEETGIPTMSTANGQTLVKLGPFWLWWSSAAPRPQER